MKNNFLLLALTTISFPIFSNPLKNMFNKTTRHAQSALSSMTRTTPRKCASGYGAICLITVINEHANAIAENEGSTKSQALKAIAKDTIKWAPFYVVNTVGIYTTAPFWLAKRKFDELNSNN